MLSKPIAGWSTLTLKNYTFPVSYTTDVPNDFIKALAIALTEKVSTMVIVDGENKGECKIIFNMVYNAVSIIFDTENTNQTEIELEDISVIDFAVEILNDFEDNLNDWKFWSIDEDEEHSFDLNLLKQAISIFQKEKNE